MPAARYEGMQAIDTDKLFDNLVTQDAKGRENPRVNGHPKGTSTIWG
jgi:hypothetical protein